MTPMIETKIPIETISSMSETPPSFERSRLRWSEVAQEPHRSLLDFHRSLIGLRRRLVDSEVEVVADESPRTLVMCRGTLRVECDFERGTVEIRGGCRS